MKQEKITLNQYLSLHNLGLSFDTPAYGNGIPTVDEAIDFLRKKYDVIIYNSFEPFVDPIDYSKITYRYSVKWCNKRDGWNGRVAIGRSRITANIYAAKRDAISLVIMWLNKRKKEHEARILRKRRKTVRKN